MLGAVKILGIDPGIGRTGWGIVEARGAKLEVRSYGCIETDKSLSLEKRLSVLFDRLLEILEKEKPEEAAVEELFFSKNVKTAMSVGHARGVALLSLAKAKLPVFEYSPSEVKLAVTGYGSAEKRQVEKMMMLTLKLSQKPKIDDTSDALAVALTHAFSRKLQVKIAR